MTMPVGTPEPIAPNPGPRRSLRPWRVAAWRRGLAWVTLGVAMLVLALGGVLVALSSQAGSRWVIDQGLALTADGQSLAQVHLDGVSGSLLGRLELRGLSVSDPDGVWLTADRLALEWRPWQVLRGRLWVEDLSAGTITVLRQPARTDSPSETEPTPAAGGGFDPLMLQRLILRGLSVDALTLNEGVIGPAAALRLRAQTLGTALGGVEAKAEVSRLDGATALTAEIALTAQRTLAVHAVVHDEKGGLLGTLSGLDGAPEISLTLDGDGPLSRWNARLFGEVADIVTMNGDMTLTLDGVALDRGMTVQSHGVLLPGPSFTLHFGEAAELALGTGVRFDLNGEQDSQGALHLEQLTLSADAWAIQGEGQLSAQGGVQARADVAISNGHVVESLTGIPLEDASLEAVVSGTLEAPKLALDVRTAGSYVDHLALTASLEPAKAGAMRVMVDGDMDQWGPEAASWLELTGPRVELRAHGVVNPGLQRFDLAGLTVATEVLTASVQGGLSWAEGVRAEGTVTADMAHLSRLSAISGLSLAGGASVSAQIKHLQQAPGKAPEAELSLAVTTQELDLGIPQANALLGQTPKLALEVRLKDQRLAVEDMALTAPGVRMAGGVTLSGLDRADPDLGGMVEVMVPDLGMLETRAKGGLRLPLTLAGTTRTPQISGTVEGQAVAWDEIALKTLTIPLSLTQEKATISDVRLEAAGTAVTGSLGVVYSPLALEGGLALTIQDPEALKPLSGGTILARDSRLSVALTAPEGRQTAQIEGRLQSISGPGVRVGQVNLKGTFTDLLATPQGSLTIHSTDLTAGDGAARFDTVETVLRLRPDQGGSLSVDVAGSGALAQPVTVQLAAQMPLSASEVQVKTLSITSDQHRVILKQPLTVALGGASVAVQGLDLSVDQGTVQGSLAQESKGAAVRYRLALEGTAIPLSIADLVVADMPLTGTADFSARLDGQKGGLTLDLKKVALPEAEVSGLGATMTASIEPRSLRAEGQVTGFGPQPVTVRAAVPMRFGADGVPQPVTSQDFEAVVQWSGPVESLWALVPAVGHRLSGEAALDAHVSGTMDQPRFTGQATVRKGRYENLEWGTVLADMAVTASLHDDGAVSVEAEANDGGRGKVEARVQMTPQVQGVPTVAALVTLNDAMVVRRDDLQVNLGGDIRYEGPAASGTLTGALTTKRVEVRLTDSLGGGVQTLPVVEINREAADLPPKDSDASSGNGHVPDKPIVLDLGISLPGQVFVRGQGLDSEWKGKLHIGGTAVAPAMKGDLSVVRGGFAVVGKDFALKKGVITFAGGPRINPGLDITAVHTTDDLVASVIVGGTAKTPTIALESTPSLPSDEILSRVLFGSSVGKLSASQALSVAQAAATLTGQGGSGPGISDMLRSSLGLDVLSFGGGSDSASAGAVEVGKYVAEGVYVGVEQGLTPQSSGVTVEIELTPRVSVESKATGAAGADVGVNYKFNY